LKLFDVLKHTVTCISKLFSHPSL